MFVCVYVCVSVHGADPLLLPKQTKRVGETCLNERRVGADCRVAAAVALALGLRFQNVSVLCFCVQDLNKRLSLPADIRIPDGYLEKLQLSSPPFDQPLSRRSRRASLVSPPTSTRLCRFFFLSFLLQSLILETPPVLVYMATGPGSTHPPPPPPL